MYVNCIYFSIITSFYNLQIIIYKILEFFFTIITYNIHLYSKLLLMLLLQLIINILLPIGTNSLYYINLKFLKYSIL